MDMRILSGTVLVQGTDHEDFGPNEHPGDNVRSIQSDIRIGDHERDIPIAPVRWGGECRVEVHMNAIARDDGVIQLNGFAAFFEGSSEDTQEQEDRKVFQFEVPRTTQSNPNPSRFHIPLRNATLVGAEDSADVFFTLTNTILEL